MKERTYTTLSTIFSVLLPPIVFFPITFFSNLAEEQRKITLTLNSSYLFLMLISAAFAGVFIGFTIKLFSKNKNLKLKLGICILWLIIFICLYSFLFLKIEINLSNFFLFIMGNLLNNVSSSLVAILLGIYSFLLICTCIEMKKSKK